jgi:hypothetical protein
MSQANRGTVTSRDQHRVEAEGLSHLSMPPPARGRQATSLPGPGQIRRHSPQAASLSCADTQDGHVSLTRLTSSRRTGPSLRVAGWSVSPGCGAPQTGILACHSRQDLGDSTRSVPGAVSEVLAPAHRDTTAQPRRARAEPRSPQRLPTRR